MWKKMLKYRRIAATFTKVEVHNGVSTSFWFDDCSDQGRLIEKTWDGGVINMGIRLHDTMALVIRKHRRRRHKVEIYNIIENEIRSLRKRGINMVVKMFDSGKAVMSSNQFSNQWWCRENILIIQKLGLDILSIKFDLIRYSFRFHTKIPDIRKLSNQSKY